jgi:flagellar basal body-associated protein FliL
MTTCSENFVNGYYRFKVKYNVDNKQIELKYSKVQSFDTLLSWFLIKINETIYIEDGKTSIMNTINYLLNDTPLNINDVKYDYL